MVHPSAFVGKTTHSLIDIAMSIRDTIFREYNKDARPGEVSYRDPGMPPLRGKYLGRPTAGATKLPAIAVVISSITYQDAPQNAGSDNEIEMKIVCFGREKRSQEQTLEAIRMVEAIRHIIIDHPTMPTLAGVEQVFQVGYGESSAEFSEEVGENFQGQVVGVEVGVLTVRAVVAESGF